MLRHGPARANPPAMTKGSHPTGAPWRNFYGRIHGKTLRPTQKDHLENDLGALSPGPVGWDENPEREKLDLGARFDQLLALEAIDRTGSFAAAAKDWAGVAIRVV